MSAPARHQRAIALGMAIALGIPWQPARGGVLGAPSSVATCIRVTATGRPWLEKTLWGLFDQERGWVGAEIPNSNGTYDLGPLQVNSAWVPAVSTRLRRDPVEVRRWLRDDACFSVGVAAWIFLSGYQRHRDFWQAVGAYHSPTAWRSRQYATAVALNLRRRFGVQAFAASKARTVAGDGSKPRQSWAPIDMRSVRP